MVVGDPIELTLVLEDLNDGKYVQAFLQADGVDYGSPIPVPNIGRGKYFYKSPSLLFPVNVFEICAEFIVYDDPAFTIVSEEYTAEEDIYQLTRTNSEEIMDKLNEIEGIVLSHDLNSSIIGEVDEDVDITGEIPDMDLIGEISDLDVVGELEEDELAGEIQEDIPIIGELEMED